MSDFITGLLEPIPAPRDISHIQGRMQYIPPTSLKTFPVPSGQLGSGAWSLYWLNLPEDFYILQVALNAKIPNTGVTPGSNGSYWTGGVPFPYELGIYNAGQSFARGIAKTASPFLRPISGGYQYMGFTIPVGVLLPPGQPGFSVNIYSHLDYADVDLANPAEGNAVLWGYVLGP